MNPNKTLTSFGTSRINTSTMAESTKEEEKVEVLIDEDIVFKCAMTKDFKNI